MKTLLVALLFVVGCTLPSVVYVDRPSSADFWQMHEASVQASQPQPVKIPRWCV